MDSFSGYGKRNLNILDNTEYAGKANYVPYSRNIEGNIDLL